jgi:hypothetical protein
MIPARLRFMKRIVRLALLALTFLSVSISASPPDPSITVPPLLDEAAQKKISSAAQLPESGDADISKVSRVRLAGTNKFGPNPHVEGFPPPTPIKQKKKHLSANMLKNSGMSGNEQRHSP